MTPLFSDPRVDDTDELYEKLAKHLLWHRLQKVQGNLKSLGIQSIPLTRDKMSVQLVTQYLNIKQRQLL